MGPANIKIGSLWKFSSKPLQGMQMCAFHVGVHQTFGKIWCSSGCLVVWSWSCYRLVHHLDVLTLSAWLMAAFFDTLSGSTKNLWLKGLLRVVEIISTAPHPNKQQSGHFDGLSHACACMIAFQHENPITCEKLQGTVPCTSPFPLTLWAMSKLSNAFWKSLSVNSVPESELNTPPFMSGSLFTSLRNAARRWHYNLGHILEWW